MDNFNFDAFAVKYKLTPETINILIANGFNESYSLVSLTESDMREFGETISIGQQRCLLYGIQELRTQDKEKPCTDLVLSKQKLQNTHEVNMAKIKSEYYQNIAILQSTHEISMAEIKKEMINNAKVTTSTMKRNTGWKLGCGSLSFKTGDKQRGDERKLEGVPAIQDSSILNRFEIVPINQPQLTE